MHDGSIIFNTKIDNADVEKDLKDLKRKIQKANESISKNETAKLPLVEQSEKLQTNLKHAKRTLKDLQNEQEKAGPLTEDQREQYKRLQAIAKRANTQQLNLQPKIELAKSEAEEKQAAHAEARRELSQLKTESERISAQMSGTTYIDPQTYLENIEKQEELNRKIAEQTEEVKRLKKEWEADLRAVEKYQQKLDEASIKKTNALAQADILAPSIQLDSDIKKQEAEVDKIEKKLAKVNDKAEMYGKKIQKSTEEIKKNSAEVGRLQSKLTKGNSSLHTVFDKAGSSANRFGKRIWEIGKSALVFNVLSAGLRGAVSYMGQCLKTNSQYTAQLAKLKAALLTAFQPIYEFVLPGLILVMKVLTACVQLLAQFLSWLTGKSLSQSAQNAKNLYNQANAIDAVGEAAQEATKDLASFDEINRLGEATISVGGVDTGTVAPDFSDLEEGVELEGTLRDIAELVLAIGAGFLAWKIASKFTDDLNKIAGIALAVGGAALYAFNWFDAWQNGIDWENLTSMLLGMTAVVVGLTLAFGTTGGAIGALITGIGLLVIAFKEWFETGTLTLETLTAMLAGLAASVIAITVLFGSTAGAISLLVAGIVLLGVALTEWITTGELTTEALIALEAGFLAVGVAISLLTGSWIPLLIAAVVGLVVLIGTRSEEIRAYLQKLDDWLQNIFATDWSNVFGPVIGNILNLFLANVKTVWDKLKAILDGILTFLGGVFTGNWQQAWEGVKQIFKACFGDILNNAKSTINSIVSFINNAVNKILDLISKIKQARAETGLSGTSSSSFSGYYAKGGTLRSGWGIVGEAGPEIIRMVGGKAVITPLNIPYLAQGAVLPANKPFMAMVGDQKHGTNIEAPLATIQEAVGLVMDDNIAAMLAGFEAVVQAIQEKNMVVAIGDSEIGEANARYSRRIALRRGN